MDFLLFFWQLSDVDVGGSTVFPNLKLEIPPIKVSDRRRRKTPGPPFTNMD